jgi:hypothetical protein
MNTNNVLVRSIVLIACATSITAVAVAAPVRWDANGHYYQAVSVGTSISWAAAKEAAKALGPGWHLATITSAKEDEFVKGLFANNPAFWINSFDERRGPWIGGYGILGKETFQWVTGEPVWFTAWATDFPIIYGGPPRQFWYMQAYGSGVVGWYVAHKFSQLEPAPIAYIAELSAPPANPGLELTQTNVAGCKSVVGRVNISVPAPAGGLVVNLSSTLNSASTPASLKIPAGATSKSFQITTRAVLGRQTGTIIATFGGQTFSRQLIVRPMGLQSLALSASTVVGGTKVIGTAKLECKAGQWPVTVSVGSNSPAWASPVAVSIVIPSEVQSGTFDITSSAVGSKKKVWIFGTANNITKSQPLYVAP